MLRKELVERAGRRRTYVVRVLYALFFCVAFLYAYAELQRGPRAQVTMGVRVDLMHSVHGLQVLGKGGGLFVRMVHFQVIGLLIFLPAMLGGTITEEKERGTLPLLMLTDISPAEGVLQKWLAGIIPMVALLLLTLPLGGFAYLIGGLAISEIVHGVGLLFLLAGVLGALAILCSSYAGSTMSAIIATYVLFGLIYLSVLPPLLEVSEVRRLLGNDSAFVSLAKVSGALTVASLLAAILFLHRRAHIQPKDRLRQLFRALDQLFQGWNRRLGNIQVIQDRRTLPESDAILWRETHRRQLGKVHYQVRYMAVAIAIAVYLGVGNVESIGLTMLTAWSLALLIVSAHASNMIVSERLSQTLEVLLTTPLSGARIVREKARALRPLCLVVAAPILALTGIVFLSDAMFIGGLSRGDRHLPRPILFALHEVLHLIVFLPLAVAIGILFGLGARTRLSAVMRALLVLVLWSALPWLARWWWMGRPYNRWNVTDIPLSDILFHLSPMAFLTVHHRAPYYHYDHLALYFGALVGYAVLTMLFLALAYRLADRKLGRPSSR